MPRRPGPPGRLGVSLAFPAFALLVPVLTFGVVAALACTPPTESPGPAPPTNAAETQPQPIPEAAASLAPTTAPPALATAPPGPAPPSATAPADPPPPDLGKFTLIPEGDRRLSPDFELVTAADEPFSIAARPGQVVVLYQTEF